MPEITDKPADDAQGGAAAGAAAGGEAAQSGTKPPKTFTQEELDAIVEARLRRAVPADYEELKKLKAERDAAAEAEKSELQKEKDARIAAEAKANDALARANRTLVHAAILAEAAAAESVDPSTVAQLLAGSDDITVADDGTVKGAKKAVADLLKEKPFLAKGTTPGASGGEFGGNDPKDKAQKIAELERKAADPTITSAQRKALYEEKRALQLA
jgi:hypothetical protein